jgi:hypothetical protein
VGGMEYNILVFRFQGYETIGKLVSEEELERFSNLEPRDKP